MEIIFLGTAGGLPSFYRSFPSIAISSKEGIILLDCGEGTARQFLKTGLNPELVKAIFITHLHFDHVLGLPAFLLWKWVCHHEPTQIFIPRGNKPELEHIIRTMPLTPKVNIHEIISPDEISISGFNVIAIEVDHSIFALGYALTNGKRKVVYTGDTRPHNSIKQQGRNADILIHDSTFGDEEGELAKKTGHSTASEAGKVAAAADVEVLILTHIHPRYDGREDVLIKQASRTFNGKILVAKDFLRLKL